MLRVASVRPWMSAVAAISMSAWKTGRPALSRVARNSPEARPIAGVTSKIGHDCDGVLRGEPSEDGLCRTRPRELGEHVRVDEMYPSPLWLEWRWPGSARGYVELNAAIGAQGGAQIEKGHPPFGFPRAITINAGFASRVNTSAAGDAWDHRESANS